MAQQAVILYTFGVQVLGIPNMIYGIFPNQGSLGSAPSYGSLGLGKEPREPGYLKSYSGSLPSLSCIA